MRTSKIKLSLLLAASAVALNAPYAYAQTASRATASGDQLQEVVVTAERHSENLQKAAVSVSVRTGDDLKAQGKYELSAILEDVPGVAGGAATTTAGAAGSPAGTDSPAAGITIRGIPSNQGVGGSAVSVATTAALYVDGVYNGIGGNYDIDRVEVLRGPQGTLYGRSATSGVLAIHTYNPDLNQFGAEATAELGNYALQHYAAAVNVPIVSDELALRVSGNYYDRDGYDSKPGGALTNEDLRAKLLFQPSDNFSVLFGFALEDNTQHGGGTAITVSAPGTFTKSPERIGTGHNHADQYWAEVNWKIGGGMTLTYLPAYRTWNSNATNFIAIPAIHFSTDQVIKTPTDNFLTQELRLTSEQGGKLTWQVGGLYYDNRLDNSASARDDVSNALQYAYLLHKSTTAAGVFGDATYAFADDWRFNGGLRYDYTEVKVNEAYTANTNLGGGAPPGSPLYGLPENNVTQTLSGSAGTKKFNNLTYKARIEHDITPENLVYAMTATGFSPGDVSVTTGATGTPAPLVFNAETLTDYEIGSKNRFLDNRLQVNGAAFYYDYKGYQLADINISAIPGLLAFSTMTAPAHAYGAELEVLYQLTSADRLGVNLGYTHATFDNTSSQIVPGTGGHTFAYYDALNNIPGVVPFSAQGSYDHDFGLWDGSVLTLHGDVRYMSGFDSGTLTQTQVAESARAFERNGGKTIGDLSATWLSGDGRYSVTAYARNVGNTRYQTNTQTNDGFPGTFSSTTYLSDPFTWGVVLGAKF